jgi:hypothetical protein
MIPLDRQLYPTWGFVPRRHTNQRHSRGHLQSTFVRGAPLEQEKTKQALHSSVYFLRRLESLLSMTNHRMYSTVETT